MPMYEHLRVSLREWTLPPLLEPLRDKRQKRHAYLLKTLCKRINFTYRNQNFVYFPITTMKNTIVGEIGKRTISTLSHGPDENFAPKKEPTWELANFFMDISEGQTEQVATLQNNPKLGSPKKIIEALFKELEKSEKPFKADIEYVVSSNKFWSTVKENQGNISEASFSFVPPNMFGGRDAFSRDMQRLRDDVGSEETKLVTKNQQKLLKLEDKRFKEIIDYALDGGGEVKLKSSNKTIFSSSKGRKTSEIKDSLPLSHTKEHDRNSIIRNLIKEFFNK